MKMSRKRALELRESKDACLTYIGPRDTGSRFCQELMPTTLGGCGFLDDTSEWIYEQIEVEPRLVYRISRRHISGHWMVCL